MEQDAVSSPARRSAAGRSESARTSRGIGQNRDGLKIRAGHRRKDDLRDSVPAPDFERLAAEIAENDFDFPAIVGIDRSGRIDAGDSVSEREPGPRADLSLEALGNREHEAGRNGGPLARCQNDRWIHSGVKVAAGRAVARVARQGQALSVRKNANRNGDGCGSHGRDYCLKQDLSARVSCPVPALSIWRGGTA